MLFEDLSPTKRQISLAAIEMFSRIGFDQTSMRDLSKKVGITNPAIYNHFESKKEILIHLYRTYEEQLEIIKPDLDRLLKDCEILSPLEIVMNCDFHFSKDIEESMNSILAIASHQITTDTDSRKFIEDNVLKVSTETIVEVVNKLVELGRIEPVNIDKFSSLVAHQCFSAVSLCGTPLRVDRGAWHKGLEYVYELAIKPTGE